MVTAENSALGKLALEQVKLRGLIIKIPKGSKHEAHLHIRFPTWGDSRGATCPKDISDEPTGCHAQNLYTLRAGLSKMIEKNTPNNIIHLIHFAPRGKS